MLRKAPSGWQWVHEVKHDGYRFMVRKDVAHPALPATAMNGATAFPALSWLRAALRRNRS